MQEGARKIDVQRILDGCAKLLHKYAWLLDCYVLDYFVDDHWSKLPKSWQQCFEVMDPNVLGNILAGTPPTDVLPLSFLALLKSVDTLSWPRQPMPSCQIPNVSGSKQSKGSIVKVSPHGYVELPKLGNTEADWTFGQHSGDHWCLRNLFMKHVKAKKRHEIVKMCEVVRRTAVESGCAAALDVGSGVGHLVRSLAYRHGLQAAGVERQAQLTDEARKLDKEFEYTASKHLSDEAISLMKRPLHLNASITPDTDFRKLGLPEELREYGVVGLHPCGDLGPFLLRHFARSDDVKFICVMGCCYMKLTCGGGGEGCGYPMSEYLRARPCRLSYASREIACHAIETYVERLRSGNYHNLQVHAYRATLEVILIETDSKFKHAGIRSIKHTDSLSFQRYCEMALPRLGLEVPEDRIHSAVVQQCLSQWRRVVTFYTLRLVLAPVVETVILLDRVLYLLERGFSCDIRPVFDPRLSPRNHIIVGKKF